MAIHQGRRCPRHVSRPRAARRRRPRRGRRPSPTGRRLDRHTRDRPLARL